MSSQFPGGDLANLNKNLFDLTQQAKITNELLRAILKKLPEPPKE